MGNVKYLCKLIGTLFVVFGAAGAGMCLVREKRDGLRFAEKTVHMLKTIRHLILYEKRTAAEVCVYLSKEKGSPFSDCFLRIVKRIEDRGGENFGWIWESEFLKEADHLFFSEEEIHHLKKVPSCMTATEPVRTAQMIDDTITFFEEQVKKRKEQASGREKVILSVSAMTGMLISILFW